MEKEEVLLSRRNGASEKEEVLLSRRDGAAEIFLLATTRGSKQELGGIRVHLEVRTSGADLGLEQSVVVLRAMCRWPAFDPLFFWGGEAQFRDQDNSVVLIAPNRCSQSSIGWITGAPMEELEKISKELKGSATL